MRVTLIIVGGKASRGRVSLELPAIVGRSRTADLTVAHAMISRRHCEVYDSGGLVMVRDLDSLNGTMVAGEKISEAGLRPDDEFTVGPLTFRVDYEYSGLDAHLPAELPFDDPVDEPQVEISSGAADPDEAVAPPVAAAEIISELEETLPEEDGSGIAPRDGRLPDLSQWRDPPKDAGAPTDGRDEASPPIDPPAGGEESGR